LADCATAIKQQGEVSSEDFVVTPAMRERVRVELEDRQLHLGDKVFAAASSYVDRQLGYDVSREVFGDAAASRRRLLDDRQMQAALELIQHSASEGDLIRLAEATAD
jgi:hypothetical protein